MKNKDGRSGRIREGDSPRPGVFPMGNPFGPGLKREEDGRGRDIEWDRSPFDPKRFHPVGLMIRRGEGVTKVFFRDEGRFNGFSLETIVSVRIK